MSPLHTLTATTLAARLRAGELSSREVVDAHLARIAAVNPAVNAVTVVLDTQPYLDAPTVTRLPAARRSRRSIPPDPGRRV
jgi:amidase